MQRYVSVTHLCLLLRVNGDDAHLTARCSLQFLLVKVRELPLGLKVLVITREIFSFAFAAGLYCNLV